MIERSPFGSTILDIGPTKVQSDRLLGSVGERYFAIGFEPDTDGRLIDVRARIAELPLRTDSVGVLLCSHVLEHVPDDVLAIGEIARVLSPRGVALIQVPRRRGSSTDEDASAPAEVREQRFGQADHVRFYGDDFEARLEKAGLRVSTIKYPWVLPRPLLRMIGADTEEELWIATTGADPNRFLDADISFRSFTDLLMAAEWWPGPNAWSQIRELEAQLANAVTETDAWRSHYLWLRDRPAIRFAAAGKHAFKRLGRKLLPNSDRRH